MAYSDVDAIFNSLRFVPEFDGNPHILTRFIKLCDQLVVTYFKPQVGHELENQALINGILNKVTGSAARLINCNGIPDTWQGIKNSLINNFADHRDETSLYSDLAMQTQGFSTPQEFYERCQNLFSTIMTHISLHENVVTTIDAKRDLYRKLTLQSYLRGLKDPLGCRIRCMRPESIEKALQYVQDEINIMYWQERNADYSNRRDFYQRFNRSRNNSTSSFDFPVRQPSYYAQFRGPPWQQPAQKWGPFSQPQMKPFDGFPSTQQARRAVSQDFNPQRNSFHISVNPVSRNNDSYQPRPMSGVHIAPEILKKSEVEINFHQNMRNSRMESGNDELTPMVVSPSGKTPSLDKSKTLIAVDPDDYSRTTTVAHSVNSILEVPLIRHHLPMNKFAKHLVPSNDSEAKGKPVVIGPSDINISSQLVLQNMISHKSKNTMAYQSYLRCCNNLLKGVDSIGYMDSRYKNREPKTKYSEQQIFSKNPCVARQELAPRYTNDTLEANLPIHVYVRGKRGPTAKGRLKRVTRTSSVIAHPRDYKSFYK